MAGKVVNQAPVYEEFEPFCKWQRKEDRDILEIHLQEFKKEQLKVQISNRSVLKIFGEREFDATTHSKFNKEVLVPSNKYDTNAINAKFVSGSLIITLPKVKTPAPEINGKMSSSEPSKKDQTLKSGSTAVAAADIGGGADLTITPGGNVSTECRFEGRKQGAMGLRLAKVVMSLAATVAAVAVLVAYVRYMYKSTVAEIGD